MDRKVQTPTATPEGAGLPSRFLTEAEVVELLGTTRRAFRHRAAADRPPCIHLSARRRIYDPAAVARWIAALPHSR